MAISERVRLKIIIVDRILLDLKVTKKKIERSVEDSKKEKITPDGISKEAFCEVTIISAEDLKPMDFNGKSDPYCIVEMGNQTQKTLSKPKTLNPVWNETFKFNVKSLKEKIKITVFDSDLVGDDDVEGVVVIPLEELKSQEKVERFFALQSEDTPENNQGRLRLGLRLVYSKYEFNKSKLEKVEAIIKENEDVLSQLVKYKKSLSEPFGLLRSGAIVDLANNNLLRPIEPNRLSVVFKPIRSEKVDYKKRVENVFGGLLSIFVKRTECAFTRSVLNNRSAISNCYLATLLFYN